MGRNATKRRTQRALLIAAGGLLVWAELSWTSTAPLSSNSVSVTLSDQLAAQGSFVIPQPVAFAGQLAAQGSIVIPQPVAFSGSMSAQGSFAVTRVTQPKSTPQVPAQTQ